MKIVFITLNDRPMLPYNYALFRSYCEQDESLRGFSWQAIYDGRLKTQEIVDQIDEPDIVALSCYMWNTNRTLYISRLIKEKYPNCKILAGGPDIYDNNFLYKYPWLDVLIYGEGEETFKEYLLGYDLNDIMGISYLQDNELKINPERLRSTKPFLAPNVYQNALLDPHVDYLHSRYKQVWALLETNRGCPYSCSFCDLGVSAMSKVRQVSDEDVYSQLDYFSDNNIHNILITDSNFGAFHRDIEIVDRIASSKKRTGYPNSLYATWAKNSNDRVFEVSKKLKDNELGWGTTLSVQSMDEQVLTAIARKNIPIANYNTLHKKYAENKMPTYTEIIIGLPLETKQSFIEGLGNILKISDGEVNEVRIWELFLTNSPLNSQREKYGIKSILAQQNYQVGHPDEIEKKEIVIETNTLPREDWVYCSNFGEFLIACHNGKMLKFLAKFLHDKRDMPYHVFYQGVFEYVSKHSMNKWFNRGKEVFDNYSLTGHDRQGNPIPANNKISYQKDILEVYKKYKTVRPRIFSFYWLMMNENLDDFFNDIIKHLKCDKQLLDVIQFQKDIILTIDYDPDVGKITEYDYNWHEYFFEHKELEEKYIVIRFSDRTKGYGIKHKIKKGDYKKFINAGLGNALTDPVNHYILTEYESLST